MLGSTVPRQWHRKSIVSQTPSNIYLLFLAAIIFALIHYPPFKYLNRLSSRFVLSIVTNFLICVPGTFFYCCLSSHATTLYHDIHCHSVHRQTLRRRDTLIFPCFLCLFLSFFFYLIRIVFLYSSLLTVFFFNHQLIWRTDLQLQTFLCRLPISNLSPTTSCWYLSNMI